MIWLARWDSSHEQGMQDVDQKIHPCMNDNIHDCMYRLYLDAEQVKAALICGGCGSRW